MQLTLPDTGHPKGRLLLESGPLAGHAYRLEPKICGNPVCQCHHFTLHCFPETPNEAVDSPAPLTLELDLDRQTLDKPAPAETTPASGLANAVMGEITPGHWQQLWSFYFNSKTLLTERANLDEVDTDFPPEAGKGAMVAYYEILPFARPIQVAAGGHEWAVDDQYCLRRDCSCRAAVLQCFRIAPQNPGDAPADPNLSFRYHYDTQRVEHVEQSGTSLSPQTLLDSMRQAQPEFDAFLSQRHAQLRHLYRLFLKRHPGARRRLRAGHANVPTASQDLPSEPVRAEQKMGRNDPCPCGSGKKYKKCCGRN